MTETTYYLPVPGRVAVIADLHNRPFFHVIQSLPDHRPEIICIAGDLVYGGAPDRKHLLIQTQKYVVPFVRACCGIAPTFLSLGNHERALADADLQRIRDTGCIVLDNESTAFGGMAISRGLSNQTPIPRLNNPTEIIYIERQD